jgi:Tfp pilus assembly protein PilZ
MKSLTRWQVKHYQPEADSVKWQFLLRFLGVESTLLRNKKELLQTLLQDQPGLILFDRALLVDAFSLIDSHCTQWLERAGGIALTGHADLLSVPAPFLARVTDISERDPFTINTLLQRFVPTYSRQHPRLGTRLPGLFTRSTGACQICEIMNLSPGGAFIRTTETLPASGEELRVNVPLIGLHKEIELKCRVVSQFLPTEANNYAQGIGVRFIAEDDSPVLAELNNYVRYVLAHDATLDPQVSHASAPRSCRKFVVKSLSSVRTIERILAPVRQN